MRIGHLPPEGRTPDGRVPPGQQRPLRADLQQRRRADLDQAGGHGKRLLRPTSLAVMSDGKVVLSGGRPGLVLMGQCRRLGQGLATRRYPAHHNATHPEEPISNRATRPPTRKSSLDDTHLIYMYDRIPHSWRAIPKGSADTRTSGRCESRSNRQQRAAKDNKEIRHENRGSKETIMKTAIRSLAWFLAVASLAAAATAAENAAKAAAPAVKSPNEARLAWWREARFGMFIHWGPVSLKGTEIGWSRGAQIPIEEYDNLYKQFNPVKFNADEWVDDRQGRRHEVHRAHHQAPRRLLHVRHEADRLQHHELAVRPGRGQGAGRGVPQAGDRLRHVLLGLRLASSRLPAAAAPAAAVEQAESQPRPLRAVPAQAGRAS